MEGAGDKPLGGEEEEGGDDLPGGGDETGDKIPGGGEASRFQLPRRGPEEKLVSFFCPSVGNRGPNMVSTRLELPPLHMEKLQSF